MFSCQNITFSLHLHWICPTGRIQSKSCHVCLDVCLSVPSSAVFLGLSLALRSHDHIKWEIIGRWILPSEEACRGVLKTKQTLTLTLILTSGKCISTSSGFSRGRVCHLWGYLVFFNRPGVAGAVLLPNYLTDAFPPNLQDPFTPKPYELGTWNLREYSPCVTCHMSHVTCHMSHFF